MSSMSVMRFDPFRDFDRLASELLGSARTPRMMPMDGYRDGDRYVLHFDLPGVDPERLDVTAENNTLTVRAERAETAPKGVEYVISERPTGVFSRQMVLGDGLDLNQVSADYHDGVLTVTVPVAEQAKPRRIEIGHRASENRGTHEGHKVIAGSSS
jgi:HSP20 family protein